MLDEELVVQGLNALFIASAEMLQQAEQIAVGRLPPSAAARMDRAASLGSLARQVGALAAAGQVLAACGGDAQDRSIPTPFAE